MSDIVIIENDLNFGKAYAEALNGTGHTVKIIRSDIEAMDYLVRQRKAPRVVVLDMRRPGGAEMVVMGAVQRLSHLAHTKVLTITQESGGGQRAGQSWGADLALSAPFSTNAFKQAIHTLTAGSGSSAPADRADPVRPTRVWWEGEEAVFIRWTNQSLVLAWPDAAETAVKIPRGAVTRLMGKGVLQIEGNVPAWVRLSRPEFCRVETRTVYGPSRGRTSRIPRQQRSAVRVRRPGPTSRDSASPGRGRSSECARQQIERRGPVDPQTDRQRQPSAAARIITRVAGLLIVNNRQSGTVAAG